jgi:hypothetical protein
MARGTNQAKNNKQNQTRNSGSGGQAKHKAGAKQDDQQPPSCRHFLPLFRPPLWRRTNVADLQLTEKTPAMLRFCHARNHLPVDLLQECRTRPSSLESKNDFGPKTLRGGLPWSRLY